MVARVNSGIDGLNGLVSGGFPQGANVLAIGGPGTGKSILSLQFLVWGAMNGEPGVYLTCDETKDKLLSQALDFGWDLTQLEKEKKILIRPIEEEFDIETILDVLENDVKKVKARRVVVDSITMLSVYSKVMPEAFRDAVKGKKLNRFQRFIEEMKRPQVIAIFQALSGLGTTNLIIAEGDGQSTVPEYAADGVIRLQQKIIGNETNRSMTVEKMRSTKIVGGIHGFDFAEGGIHLK
ncbi:MAG: ATPase domain-containing protein [Candidatus Altiarchaeota archaeon]